MKDQKNKKFPAYIPIYYRGYAQVRKVFRQWSVREAEKNARQSLPLGVFPDGRFEKSRLPADHPSWINKNAHRTTDTDLEKPEIKKIADEIERLKFSLSQKGLAFTNTAATFLPRMFYPRSEKTKLWENSWVIYHSGVKSGHDVLDIGGASTPFSFYLASLRCNVRVVDNDWGNCGTLYNAEYVARQMGWDLKVFDRDIAKPLPFGSHFFDRVFSICTIEHLSSPVRRQMMKEVGRVLKPGGIAGITMCYDLNHTPLLVDRGLRFGYREKFENDVIKPSGLEIYGNPDLADSDEFDGFLGAIFLRKPFKS